MTFAAEFGMESLGSLRGEFGFFAGEMAVAGGDAVVGRDLAAASASVSVCDRN